VLVRASAKSLPGRTSERPLTYVSVEKFADITGNPGSIGLGLDIARRTAESSGGSLSLRSSPEGGASVILFLAEA
jgi:signal transduction histidine kinase